MTEGRGKPHAWQAVWKWGTAGEHAVFSAEIDTLAPAGPAETQPRMQIDVNLGAPSDRELVSNSL